MVFDIGQKKALKRDYPFGFLTADLAGMKTITTLFFGLTLAVIGGSAFGKGLEGHDTEQPIDIVADGLEVNQDKKMAVFEGAVEVTQGELKFLTETLRVYYETDPNSKNPKIARLDATGRVRLESPDESAEGNWAVYDVKSRTVTIVGEVWLKRENSELKGERLEIDLVSGVTKFDGQPLENQGRVSGRFELPEDKK